jgi:hypothetical protein
LTVPGFAAAVAVAATTATTAIAARGATAHRGLLRIFELLLSEVRVAHGTTVGSPVRLFRLP